MGREFIKNIYSQCSILPLLRSFVPLSYIKRYLLLNTESARVDSFPERQSIHVGVQEKVHEMHRLVHLHLEDLHFLAVLAGLLLHHFKLHFAKCVLVVVKKDQGLIQLLLQFLKLKEKETCKLLIQLIID